MCQARSQKFAMGGLFWGSGGKASSRRRHGGLGAEPPALANFAFFCKMKSNFRAILIKIMLFKRGIELSCARWFYWLHYRATWEVANENVAVLLFTCWSIIKSYYSIKLSRSNLFRLYFIKKNNRGGGGGANGKIFERSDW